MHTPGPEAAVAAPQLSRGCASRGEKEGLHKQLTGSRSAVGEVPGIVQQVLGSPGQPLDAPAHAFFELRFGHDFSRVRVHADGQAAESVRAVDALAFTAGQHVVFGTGLYGDKTAAKRKLLAHELAHTIQQSSGLDVAAHGEAVLQRAPVGETSSALPVMPRLGDFRHLPRYIDNLFQSVSFPSLIDGSTAFSGKKVE
jgi:Domain of unknown function (DUF4157)